MLAYTTAYADTPAEHVDLSKPVLRTLDTITAPAVGDIVLRDQAVSAGKDYCGARTTGPDGGDYLCNRAEGHDRTTHPCTAVMSEGWDVDGGGRYTYRVVGVSLPDRTPTAVEYQAARREAEQERARAAILATQVAALQQREEDIREYVLERRSAGEICDAGTLRFLRHFGMTAWERQFTLTYTVTVNVDDCLSGDQARTRAHSQLMYNADGNGVSVSDVDFQSGYDEDGNDIDDD